MTKLRPAVRRQPRIARTPRADRLPSLAARRALVASLSSSPPPPTQPSLASLVAACDESELVDLVISEGLSSPASHKLAHLLSPAQRSRLIARAREEALRHLAYLELLDKFGTALEEANVTWAVLKGPVLAELSYGDLARGYTDLDLLVPARQLREAVRALEAMGAELADQDWPMIRQGKGELSMAMFGMPLLDLHWHLVFDRRRRERFLLSTDDLLERRRQVHLGPVRAWALDPTDFAIHVALHASFAGAQRLRRLLDIERTLMNQTPDWDLFVQRCREWRVGLPVCAMLNCAHQVLGAAVPEEVVAELADGRLERLLVRELGAWLPGGRLPGGRSIRVGLSRSLRDSPRGTAGAFAREILQALADITLPRWGTCTRFRASTDDSSGQVWFEHYLARVTSADGWGHL